MSASHEDRMHEWRFRIGDAFPAESPLARFIVAVAQGMNDSLLANTLFVKSEKPYEHIYFFNLASSHLFEVAEMFRKAHGQWEEVRDFISTLDRDRRAEFESIAALAAPEAGWPGNRLKELRNSFFHYLRLDLGAANAGKLPLVRGLTEAIDTESSVIIEALFADEIFVKTLSANYEDDEYKRLVASLAQYQIALNNFAQVAVGRYLRNLPKGVVQHEVKAKNGAA
jgi:hypothetical protein